MRALRHRRVDGRLGSIGEASTANVAHDTDDVAHLTGRVLAPSQRDGLADGVFVREELLGECLIDDEHLRRARPILLGDPAAAEHGRSHRLEKAWRHDANFGARLVARAKGRFPANRER